MSTVHDQIWHDLTQHTPTGEAARLTLTAGVSVYYRENETPHRHAIREHPNNSRELVRYDRQSGDFVTVEQLPSRRLPFP